MLNKKITIIILIILLLTSILVGCNNTSPADNENTPQPTPENEPTEAPPDEEEEIVPDEMIVNGDFSLGYDSWGMYTEGTVCSYASSDGTALIPIHDTGTVDWAVQPYQDGILMSKGCEYKIKLDIKSTVPRTVKIRIQKNGSPYTGYLEEIFNITEEFTTVEFNFTMEYDSDPTSRLVFNLGKFEDEELPPHEVEIDNVSLIMTKGEETNLDAQDNDINNIRINQVGYKPNNIKLAVFANIDSTIDKFNVISSDGKVVYTGEIGDPVEDENSGEIIRIGDFSQVVEEGTYHIELDDYGSSYDFVISENIYNDLFYAVNKMFYYQRCSMVLSEEYAGDFAHDACHTYEAKIYDTNETVDVSGGWHDAGDFGRYVSPAAKAVIDLLLSYESFPESFTDDTNIPEAGNGIPDILDEVKYELEFLLKMQDTSSGGVYHKVTTASFADVEMPDESNEELIISPISAVATADFAAVMAKAYSIYSEIDSDFAQSCLDSAQLAWQWLENNPNEHVFINPAGINTGEYGDDNSNDERFWAAAELYSATGNTQYHEYLKNAEITTGMGWQDVGMYGIIAYLKIPDEKCDAALYDKMLQVLLGQADKIVENSNKDMFRLSLTKDDYVWGSNMHVADNAMILLIANKYSKNQEYVDIAFEHLNYLLGKNALSISYITGFGTNTVHNVHHRVTQTVGEVFDGLVAGGPNANLEDPYAQTMLSGKAPAKCYADNDQSYSTNEITIYWNSPVVYLISYFK